MAFQLHLPKGKQVLNLLEVLKIPKKGQKDPFNGPSSGEGGGTRTAVVAVAIRTVFMARQVLCPALPRSNSQQPHEAVTAIIPK